MFRCLLILIALVVSVHSTLYLYSTPNCKGSPTKIVHNGFKTFLDVSAGQVSNLQFVSLDVGLNNLCVWQDSDYNFNCTGGFVFIKTGPYPDCLTFKGYLLGVSAVEYAFSVYSVQYSPDNSPLNNGVQVKSNLTHH